MTDSTRVGELVDELIESGRTPEEVCEYDPQLLSEVRGRWQRVCAVRAELDAWFPEAAEPAAVDRPAAQDPPVLPTIPGYEVAEVIGRGGMGVVFRARHVRLNRFVALKMVLAGAYAGPAERERFQREAETVAALDHPNIVPIFDVGEADGRPYFTMELVPGGNLAQRLAGTPLPAAQAVALLVPLTDAIDAAHRSCVVHRDLKPANVLLTADGTPKVSDFGLAHRRGGEALTQTGAPLGTPSYMAPEQAHGRAGGAEPAADIYALGAILYDLLTGRPPFRAETAAETVLQVLTQDPVPPSRLNARVPRDLETICLKCLEKRPDRRYATAAALGDDLRRFERGETIAARPVGRPERVLRWVRRHPAPAALILTASLLFAIIIAAGVRERELAARQRAEFDRWADRLAFVTKLEQDGRFPEARAILQAAQTDDPGLRPRVAEAQAALDLIERLDAIRLGRGRNAEANGLDYAESSRRYAETFRKAGLGVVGDDADRVAARLAASPVRKALLDALDDWAACAEKADRDWVLRVALRADPDPWRDRVRDPDGWAKVDTFPELAAAANIRDQPVNLMVAFGTRWRRLGGDPTAFLEQVQRRYPNDFWVNFELGYLLADRDRAAAVGHLRAALAVRPDAAVVHFNIAFDFLALGNIDAALHHYRRGLEMDPDFTPAYTTFAATLIDHGELAEGIAYCRKALLFDPKNSFARGQIRRAQLKLGRPDEACDEWRQFLATGSHTHVDWDGYAEFCLFLGREDEYRRACREVLERFGASADPQVAERTARACLLAPVSPEETRRAGAVIDRAIAEGLGRAPDWAPPYFWFAKGLAEYRLGNSESAVAIITGKAGGVLGPAPRLVVCLAQHRLGRTAEARAAFDAALPAFDWQAANATTREAWIYHALRREAEAALRSKK